MKKLILSLLLLSLVLILIVGCGKEEIPATKEEPTANQIIPVAVKVDSITNETLEKLKAEGMIINDTEQSKTYGNVIFGTINTSKVGLLEGNVTTGISEKEYKTEVLTQIAIVYDPNWKQNPRDLGFLAGGQVVLDEQRKAQGITIGPLIEDQLWQRVEKEEYVPIFISFRVEAWKDSEQKVDEIKEELGKEIKVEIGGWKGISGYLTKEGLNKLVNKEYILEISTRIP